METDYGQLGSGLQINFKDAADVPIRIESGTVHLYRHARAAEVMVATVARADDGIIEVASCFSHHGLWQVEVDVIDRDGNRFVESRRMDIVGNSQTGRLLMFALGMAVVVASLLGSLHCVGMCGPLAIWATSEGTKPVTLVSYHLGRLTTYLSAGLMAGLLGSALTIGGDFAGLQSLAAMIAGGFLVLLGVIRMAQYAAHLSSPSRSDFPNHLELPGGCIMPNRCSLRADHLGRSYLAGLLTTWLPCGWLYLFVLIAAGTGSVISAIAVMLAFWIGTLPALTGLVLGAGSLMKRSTTVMPIAASLLLIATGLYTATGRASADLTSIVPPNTSNVQDPTVADLTARTNLCPVARDRSNVCHDRVVRLGPGPSLGGKHRRLCPLWSANNDSGCQRLILPPQVPCFAAPDAVARIS